ncbi:zinc dependent phospholipase C family protein [Desulfosporosinus sp. FKB]|uniref:zinc dependent phospholipase C family protein n=1 Tax=Desulfosporosinus sp. FKB TaxID=1969835 RepID=UPI000B49C045|nr:zinc dependent phospholipase C family protein [Desulfosporosinus sp. FKB]
MGSRIMHISIATKVCAKVELNKNRFLLGSIAPDAYLPSKQFKMISHFANKGNGPSIDSNAFLDKYNNCLNDSFYLGYYCHLLSDKLWFSKYHKKMQTNRNHYEDYNRLTNILIRYYKLENNFSFFDDFFIQEIDMNVFRNIFEELKNDFILEKEITANLLEMFEVEDIKNYIEEAVKLSVNSIEAILLDN